MASPAPDRRVVLLVEDEPLVRAFVADVLTDAGFRVLEAVNAHEALVLLQARPDVLVLITDVNMAGGMNGLELARSVHGHWPNISILIMSGRMRPSLDEVPAGSVFIPKPCTALKLIEQVRAAADRGEAIFAKPASAPLEVTITLDAGPASATFLTASPEADPPVAEGDQPVPEPDRS